MSCTHMRVHARTHTYTYRVIYIMTGLMWSPNQCRCTKEGSLTYLERKGREGRKLRAEGQVEGGWNKRERRDKVKAERSEESTLGKKRVLAGRGAEL